MTKQPKAVQTLRKLKELLATIKLFEPKRNKKYRSSAPRTKPGEQGIKNLCFHLRIQKESEMSTEQTKH